MTTESRPTTPAADDQAYRERMRSMAMRPVMIWVTDIDSPDFDPDAPRRRAVREPDLDGEEMEAFRERMREDGRVQTEIWVPDREAPHYEAELRRQLLLAANSAQAEEDQAFVDSISIFWEPEFWE